MTEPELERDTHRLANAAERLNWMLAALLVLFVLRICIEFAK